MEATAILKYGHMGPRKARGVVDLIRGKGAADALNILKFAPQHAARVVAKLLKSAVANAAQKDMGEADLLWVSKIFVDGAPVLKRTQPRARGRAFLIRKRMSHITIVLSEREDTAAKKQRAQRTGKG